MVWRRDGYGGTDIGHETQHGGCQTHWMRNRATGSRAGLGVLAGLGMLAGAVLVVPSTAEAQTDVQDGAPICGTVAGSGAPTADDGVLRIATYNVLHTRGAYDDETLDRRIELVSDALAASGADVAGLQEVVRSANHGLVAERIAAGLASRTGDDWAWCFFQSNPHVPGEPDTGPGGIGGPISQAIAGVARSGDSPWSEGVAIVSRFPITDQASHRLAPRTAEAPVCQVENPDNPLATPTCAVDTRQILWTRIATSCGGFDMFSSHLANDESSASEQSRQVQMADALLQIDQRSTDDATPDVYVGDFNTLEDGPVWQAAIDAGFVDGFRAAAPDDAGLTSGQDIADPASTVGRRIDYVFARPGSQPLAVADGVVIGDAPVAFAGRGGQTVVWPSDHYGVAVTLLEEAACAGAGAEPVSPPQSSAVAETSGAPGGGSLPATGTDVRTGGVALVLLASGAWMLRRRMHG